MKRQYGCGNSKYVVIFYPLITGHVTWGMHSQRFGLEKHANV